MLLTTLGLYLLRSRTGFMLLLLATPVANETVTFVFVVWLSLRFLTSQADREALALPWAMAMAALMIYVVLIEFDPLPGAAAAMYSDDYLRTLQANLAELATPDGVMRNALPVALLLALGVIGHLPVPGFARAWRAAPRPRWQGMFRPVDLLVIPILAVAALVLTQRLDVGPIVMHAAPLFVVPGAAALVRRLGGAAAAEGHHP